MLDFVVPDLTFPSLAYGTHKTPHNLRTLLYRGASAIAIREVASRIDSGSIGPPLVSRLPLVEALHAAIAAEVAKGKSRGGVDNKIRSLRIFTAWCDTEGRELTLATAADDYRAWIEALLHRVRIEKSIKNMTAYGMAGEVDVPLSMALGMARGLRRRTRLKASKQQKRALGTQADKQRLDETFAIGHFLLDISDGLTIEAVRGPLPVEIRLRSGGVLIEWSKLWPLEKVKGARGIGSKTDIADSLASRAAWEADGSRRTRHSLINLRIEAELLILIAQTGMNLAQAHRLKRGQFRYQTMGEDVLVFRVYKGRRGGEAEFRIFRAYRPFFERYLAWLDAIIPSDEDARLFPFVYLGTIPAEGSPPSFTAIRSRCNSLNISFVGARRLRKTRVNWLLRRSRDTELTAEQAQHSQETLLAIYEQPHHQVAAVEITRFHRLTDPSIAPPGPGACVQIHQAPRPLDGSPPEAPTPDCVNPAGCLFCVFHRDIDTETYVWSLASYRHLKTIELCHYVPPVKVAPPHPAVAAIDRITAKLDSLSASSEIRALWVRESLDRVREGRYHPAWDGFIQCMELGA